MIMVSHGLRFRAHGLGCGVVGSLINLHTRVADQTC